MKNFIYKNIKISALLALLLISKAGFSQKSINYESVRTDLEEISAFFHDSALAEIENATLVEKDSQLFLPQKYSGEIMESASDWAKKQLCKLNEASFETKQWLANKKNSPTKYSKRNNKYLAEN